MRQLKNSLANLAPFIGTSQPTEYFPAPVNNQDKTLNYTYLQYVTKMNGARTKATLITDNNNLQISFYFPPLPLHSKLQL